MNPDERSNENERRRAERVGVSVEIEWATNGVRHPGTLGDISVGGCYVLSNHHVMDGEVVRLYFPLSTGKQIEILGETTNHVPEIGFAVRFMGLTDEHIEFLESFAEVHRRVEE